MALCSSRSSTRLAFAAVAAFAAAAPAAASATIMLPLSIEDMAVRSTAVVRAKVVSSKADWDEQHQRIYTQTTVEVLEPLYAKDAVPRQLVVRTLGGEVGGIGMKVSGVERFEAAEEVLLFVHPDPAVPAAYQVVGMSQGKYRIEREAGGKLVAVPSTEGLAFVTPDPSTQVMKVDPSASRPARIALTDLASRVRAAIAALGSRDQPQTAPRLVAPPRSPSERVTPDRK